MKKLIAVLGFVGLLAASPSALAVNVDSAAVFLNNYDANFAVLAVGGGNAATFYVEVLAGVNSGSLFAIDPNGVTGVKFTESEPGFFDAGIGTIPTVAALANGTFQVRAWQGTASDTFDTASIKGSSAVWTQATGKSSTEPPSVSAVALLIPGPIQLQLAVVPEPSTIALGVLGGLGLLLRRRK